MTTTIHEYIHATERRTAPESDPPAGHPSGLRYRGHGPSDPWDMTLPLGGEIDDDMSDGYRIVAFYDMARAILTNCEGDLDLEVYPTHEAYTAALASARAFYAAH